MIIQGDNGVSIKMRLVEKNNNYTSNLLMLNSDIKDILVNLKTKTRSFFKYAIINENNICEITLDSNDLSESGIYEMQVTVNYIDGSSFSSNINKIKVGEKL